MSTATDKAAALIEALPYLQRFRGATFLIKMGGSAMEDPALVREVMRDVVFLEVAGVRPIIVHGGGKAISAAMNAAGLEAQFIGGLRVTTPEAIDIVEKTLNEQVNADLVKMLNGLGGKATPIHGTDVFTAEKLLGKDDHGQPADIGRVGRVVSCRTEDLLYATSSNIVPVISPLGSDQEAGHAMNINADLAAAALACTLKPAKLVYLSDVPGLLRDPADSDTLIESITIPEARELIADGTISGGMIPKITSAIEALDAGVQKVHFIDGRRPHSLLLEIFTQSGIGTEIR
ncbi:MAG: acetylglutamate kinase [Verrucomicrobiales bacterium]